MNRIDFSFMQISIENYSPLYNYPLRIVLLRLRVYSESSREQLKIETWIFFHFLYYFWIWTLIVIKLSSRYYKEYLNIFFRFSKIPETFSTRPILKTPSISKNMVYTGGIKYQNVYGYIVYRICDSS